MNRYNALGNGPDRSRGMKPKGKHLWRKLCNNATA